MSAAGSRGFTLVELVLVLAIGAVLAAIAAPKYAAATNRYRVDGAARRLAADLSLARATAKATSGNCSVAFRATPNSYGIPTLAASDGRGGVYSVQLGAEPYNVSIASIVFSDGLDDDILTFDGYGVPDSGITIVIGARGWARTVAVAASTGEVTVQ